VSGRTSRITPSGSSRFASRPIRSVASTGAVPPAPVPTACFGSPQACWTCLQRPSRCFIEYRWTIEIFFRFFKHILGCRHLLSHDEHGIEIQTYCAIIACMLISLWTGRKPTLRTYEMICFYFCGLATDDELLAHIGRLQMQPPDS
jgi:hypothetical protein